MRNFWTITTLILLLTSCTKESELSMQNNSTKLYISVEEESRILLNQSVKTVWTAGDELSVFYNSESNECWRFIGNTGDTHGALIRKDKSFVQANTTDKIVSLYPYSQNNSLIGNTLNTSVADTQIYSKDSYGLGANIMLGISTSENIHLKNICGYLCISFTGEQTIESIELRGNSGETIAGAASINIETMELSFAEGGKSVITLDCQQGVELKKDKKTTFYFALAPQQFKNGISITAHCTSGSNISKSTNKIINITRNTILPMETLDYQTLRHELERSALVDLYNSTNGKNWRKKSNWCTSASVSSWQGVTTDEEGYVVGIDLFGNNLIGTIPSSLHVLMDNCKYLRIGGNKLIGAVPQSVLTHHMWQYLWGDILAMNNLTYNKADIQFPQFTINDTDGLTIDSQSVWNGKKAVLFYGWDENCLNDYFSDVYYLYYDYASMGLEVLAWTTEYFYNNFEINGGYAFFPWKTYPQLASLDNSFRPGYGYYPTSTLPSITLFGPDKQLLYSSALSGTISMTEVESIIENIWANPEYESKDYSKDGQSTQLQKASIGNGIDIVLMGDGYSDRLIANGTYEATMRKAMEAFFSEEPYKSFRNLFNVYYVTVVSKNEGFGNNYKTAMESYFGEGTEVGGNDQTAMQYALEAIDYSRLDNATIIVMLNSTRYAGTCYMYYPDGWSSNATFNNDHSQGISVSYFPVGIDDAALTQVLTHEACGHGFAKLNDEYAYEENGRISSSAIAGLRVLEPFGWWKNTDFTSDTSKIKWAKFIADSRYKYDGLGAFEGASTYWRGVWRPTDNSIMRHNTDGFNAPSREAIYYRLHKLAHGTSWQYDYETFVAYDAVNRKSSAIKPLSEPMVMRPVEHTKPVIRPYSWREVLNK